MYKHFYFLMKVLCLMGFLTPYSFWMMDLIEIHEYNLILTIFLLTFLICALIFIYHKKDFFIQPSSSSSLEFWWTALPLKIVSILLFPTLLALYKLNFFGSIPLLTLKVVGHQWYWEYNLLYKDTSLNFDSFMTMPSEVGLRLLDCSPGMVLPSNVLVRLLVTSSDVLHSFFIPSLGVKVDAVPGRLSEFLFQSNLNGVVGGMCAEICGKGHGAMPIQLMFISVSSWKSILGI